VKDDVAVPRHRPTSKRERLLSAEAEARLRKLLMQRLGKEPKITLQQIEKCFPPFLQKPSDVDDVPDQVLVFKERRRIDPRVD
jgi:hypothetical protein